MNHLFYVYKTDVSFLKVDVTQSRLIKTAEAKPYLSKLADSFLEHAFNALLASVKKDFDVERQTIVEEDYFNYLSVANLFLAYHSFRRKVTLVYKIEIIMIFILE